MAAIILTWSTAHIFCDLSHTAIMGREETRADAHPQKSQNKRILVFPDEAS